MKIALAETGYTGRVEIRTEIKAIFDGRSLYDLQKMTGPGYYYNFTGRKTTE